MEQTDQRLWTGSRFFLLRLIAISLLTIGTIPAKASDPPERAEISEQLKTLITHTKRIDLSAYPAMYADQVAHALQKAEGTMARIESTGEQLNIARLALQVALDKLVADLQKVTIMDLQNLVRSGKLTYRALTQMYLNRIELYDLHTIKL
ncbi:MAG: hypothetical protein LBE79_12640, partial [Tannerella sp.]|nr:hypothetical protein [Tannerella sp.]